MISFGIKIDCGASFICLWVIATWYSIQENAHAFEEEQVANFLCLVSHCSPLDNPALDCTCGTAAMRTTLLPSNLVLEAVEQKPCDSYVGSCLSSAGWMSG